MEGFVKAQSEDPAVNNGRNGVVNVGEKLESPVRRLTTTAPT